VGEAAGRWSDAGLFLGHVIQASEVPQSLWVMGERMRVELEAEIARLRAELDERENRPLLLCPDNFMEQATASCPDAIEGTVIRATDTGRQLVLDGGLWVNR
jgi:hypothetical protein